MRTFPKLLTICSLLVISAAAIAGWVMFLKVKSENQALAAQLASGKSGQETKPQSADDEMSTNSGAEHDELLRLRGEVGQIRSQKEELDRLGNENRQLRESLEVETNRVHAQWKSWMSGLRTNEIYAQDYPSLVQPLSEALTNSDPSIRADAARVLRNIGLLPLFNTNLTAQQMADLKSAAIAVVPSLLAALKDPDPLVHANVAITLGFLHEDTQEVVPALMEDLNSNQTRIAGAAAKALGRLQGDASSAVPALVQVAQTSSDPDIRASAIDALKQIDPAAARNSGF